ncbi:hypothetical protein B0H16DRAFT_1779812 [Mycena metata]|uniref:Uncharacterized protein n=1 Tax=Mycena metata TaxID=1033252 RepID=A0AAD7MPK3_9AGAR|nr:hypothetical protein B0H16DRAFT_1779812 [Mycena metata]
MLFWIFVFLLTRQSSLTQGHPDLLSRAATEASCDSTINSCRTLFDIVWGCLATIFACIWVALHQNVPDPKLGWFSLLMRKLRMMLVTIIAPELVLVAYMPAIKAIDKEDLKDKSKGDTLSNGVAIAQGLWFLTQCLARVSQHLPLTKLEVATLAFAVLGVVIRLLWLHKPLDVQQPMVVARSEVEIVPLQEEDMNNFHTFLQKLGGVMTGKYDEYSPLSSTSVPSFYYIEISAKDAYGFVTFAGVFGVGTIFGSIHCAAWNALFPSMAEMWIWRISSVFIAAYPGLIILCGAIARGTLTPDNKTAHTVLTSLMVLGTVYPLF